VTDAAAAQVARRDRAVAAAQTGSREARMRDDHQPARPLAGVNGRRPGPQADPDPDGAPQRLARLAFPASQEYVALGRLAVLHVAASLGLSAERAADLRLAVAEGCGQFLPGQAPDGAARGHLDGHIEVRFEHVPGMLRITLRGPATEGWPDRDGLGWLVLSTLVGDLRCARHGGVGVLTFVERLPAPERLSFFAF
jgi:hypothetical protein